MLTKRIIPCLDVNSGCVIKGVDFVNLRDAGDPVEIATAYGRAGVDELVFLDIMVSSSNRRIMVDMVGKVAETVFTLFTVDGGIRTVEDFRMFLREDAGKISINPSAINNPRLVSDAADKFGRQRVVVAIDVRRRADGEGWNIYKHGGRVDVGIDTLEQAMGADRLGMDGIPLISMDYDGTGNGYDNESTSLIASHVSVPAIASGGARNEEHFYDAPTKDGADAALVASLFHYKEPEMRDFKGHLSGGGITVRIQRKGWNTGAGDFDGGSRKFPSVNSHPPFTHPPVSCPLPHIPIPLFSYIHSYQAILSILFLNYFVDIRYSLRFPMLKHESMNLHREREGGAGYSRYYQWLTEAHEQ